MPGWARRRSSRSAASRSAAPAVTSRDTAGGPACSRWRWSSSWSWRRSSCTRSRASASTRTRSCSSGRNDLPPLSMIRHRLGGKHVDDDDLLDSHPDLMDPEWRKHARTDAWLGAKKDRKQLRKQRKRGARKPHRRWWILGVLVAILAVTTAAIVLVGRRAPAREAVPETPNPTQVAQYAHVDLAQPYVNTP